MTLSSGCHHVATVTPDLDRLIAFYTEVFDAEVDLDMSEPGDHTRHALIALGGGFFLHPFQFAEGHGPAPTQDAFAHVCIAFDDMSAFEIARRRLVERQASEGRVRDFGRIKICSFTDPDGRGCEIGIEGSGPVRSMAESTLTHYPEPA